MNSQVIAMYQGLYNDVSIKDSVKNFKEISKKFVLRMFELENNPLSCWSTVTAEAVNLVKLKQLVIKHCSFSFSKKWWWMSKSLSFSWLLIINFIVRSLKISLEFVGLLRKDNEQRQRSGRPGSRTLQICFGRYVNLNRQFWRQPFVLKNENTKEASPTGK